MIQKAFRIAFLLATPTAFVCAAEGPTVLWGEIATDVDSPLVSPDLWVTTPDLIRATGFVLKPQGVCREDLCVPIPKGRKAEFLSEHAPVTWFNLSAFARLLKQPAAFDETLRVWYFGPRPAEGVLASLQAPDFTLPDMEGKRHSLADFRGKKVLLITWASW